MKNESMSKPKTFSRSFVIGKIKTLEEEVRTTENIMNEMLHAGESTKVMETIRMRLEQRVQCLVDTFRIGGEELD